MAIVIYMAQDLEMKKIIFSLTFLLIIIVLRSGNSYAQSFQPLSFLKSTVPFISINDYTRENNKAKEEISEAADKKIKSDTVEVQKPTSDAKPVTARITIDLGKALFEKYIK